MDKNSHEDLLTDEHFMNAVEVINSADTVKDIIEAIPDILKARMTSYHHFPAVGSYGFKNLSQYYSYGLPQIAKDYFDDNYQHRDDPGVIAAFQRGQFIWFSDMPHQPYVIERNYDDTFRQAISIIGEGLCIPLYGPSNRKGYLFAALEGINKLTGCFIPYKIQALAQLIHIRYCLLIERMHIHVQLTPREAEVLELISFGKSNVDIGTILNISPNTVAVYVKRIFIKLNVSDRVSAAMRAQSTKIKI